MSSSDMPLTKSEHIRRAIRDDILSGRLRPGDSLKLEEQASRFGATSIPVREALRALQADRLVTIRPHQTATVAPVELAEQEDIYGVRVAVESEVMRRAAVLASDASLAMLHRLAEAHETALRGGPARSEAHKRFHFAIYEAAGSPTLQRIAADLWRNSDRCRRVLRAASVASHARDVDHVALVESLAARDPDRAADIMRRHLEVSIAALRAAFAKAQPSHCKETPL